MKKHTAKDLFEILKTLPREEIIAFAALLHKKGEVSIEAQQRRAKLMPPGGVYHPWPAETEQGTAVNSSPLAHITGGEFIIQTQNESFGLEVFQRLTSEGMIDHLNNTLRASKLYVDLARYVEEHCSPLMAKFTAWEKKNTKPKKPDTPHLMGRIHQLQMSFEWSKVFDIISGESSRWSNVDSMRRAYLDYKRKRPFKQ